MMTKMNIDTKFYDTCSLLLAGESLFKQEEKFAISSISFKELENIKTSASKDQETKYSARLLLNLLEQHPDMYDVVIHKTSYEGTLNKDYIITDDLRILSDAIWYDRNLHPDATIFVTNDLNLKYLANILYFGEDSIIAVELDKDQYTGYKEIELNDEELEQFYQDSTYNYFNLYIGQYLIIKQNNEIIDIRVWTGQDHRYLNYDNFNSTWFGKIKPYQGDIYQKLLFDSLSNNKITMVEGPAGSGKTMVSLGYLMSELDKGRLGKIVVFCNTVATANSAKLGYLPGDRETKLLDSQVGNLLASKFGGRGGVEQLMANEKLFLLPMSDIRGFDTTGMKAGIYISEAQNLDRALIKLALQRIGEDCICIIDGDYNQQVDLPAYAGNNNGMRRVSKVFRGTPIYGEVMLKNIYRSQISQIAEQI